MMISMISVMMIPIMMAGVGVEREGVDQRLAVPHLTGSLQLAGSEDDGGPEESKKSELNIRTGLQEVTQSSLSHLVHP